MLQTRSSGLLLHITSLPSVHGIGDLGPEAYRFADFLKAAGQSFWQILPLTPLDPGAGFSPYSSPSAFAGNVLLISLEKLADEGLLTDDDLAVFSEQPLQAVTISKFDPESDDETSLESPLSQPTSPLYAAWLRKRPLLDKGAERFLEIATASQFADYERFCGIQAHWLDDYTLFSVLQETTSEPFWLKWSDDLKRRDPIALAHKRSEYQQRINVLKVQQYLFSKQWAELNSYCFNQQIHLMGDIPIYVQLNSADVWTNPTLFKLDANLEPLYAAGAPPDYFSEDGQRWGNPIYDWNEHERTGFSWWMRRIRHQLSLYSLTRLDHFLGFFEYWEIPVDEPTARVGEWIKAPFEAFMQAMYRQFVYLPVIAEDLGAKAGDIQGHLRHYAIPGMRVLQFSFAPDLPTSSYSVHNHTENMVVYSGTHDNNTTLGWFREADDDLRQRITDYVGFPINEANVVDQIMRLTMQSVGRLAIIPVQDVLNLDETHRMNTPGAGGRSWQWRLDPGQLTEEVAERLRKLTEMTGRVAASVD